MTTTDNFEDLMAQMGVRPMERGGQKRSVRTKPKAERAVSHREAARRALQPPASPRRSSASELLGRISELEQQLSAARATLAAEQAAHQRLSSQLEAAEAERDQARHQAAELEQRLEEQAIQLRRIRRRLSSDDAPVSPRLTDVLEQRGVKGADEASFLIRSLMQTRQLGGLVTRLQTADPEDLGRWLEDRAALLCEEHAALLPTGRARLQVPPQRCEICGGSDLKRAVRHFVDAALINGMTRIIIIGGGPKHHRLLRELVVHRGLKLQLASSHRTPNQIRADLHSADVIVLWHRRGEEDLREAYSAGPAQLVVGTSSSIARLLGEVAEQL